MTSGTVSFRTVLLFVVAYSWLHAIDSVAQSTVAQSTSENDDATVHGIVLNSVTREPIPRALVHSPDNRFATLTNSEGRFEFALAKTEQTGESGSDSNSNISVSRPVPNRPYMLIAHKPGFLTEPNRPFEHIQSDLTKDFTLELIPESLIVGTVTLPTSEAPDSITLQIFRRQIQDGVARYVSAGGSRTASSGQFRFAGLQAGTYKLLTHELLDRDPLTADPGGALFGYPPVYYQNAQDFGAAGTIEVSAGQTQVVHLTLVKQPYYRVKIPVIALGTGGVDNGVGVNVYAHGHKGPGFTLGYNNAEHAIDGSLPNGTYMIEASSYGGSGSGGFGVQTITVKGGPIDGPSLTLVASAPIQVNVKEEFTGADHSGRTTWNINGRNIEMKGVRRYLNAYLEPAEDGGMMRGATLREPTGAPDEPLLIDAPQPGSYWVRVNSSRGYPASIRAGNLDLLHQPLVVGVGGAVGPIEITMRDDNGEISGTVEGIPMPRQEPGSQNSAKQASFDVTATANVYCIPMPDSPGQFTQIWVGPDGSFDFNALAPGAYRVLAFDHEPQLEYRNPEAMRAYDAKGPVVRILPGQKERVTVQLVSMEHL